MIEIVQTLIWAAVAILGILTAKKVIIDCAVYLHSPEIRHLRITVDDLDIIQHQSVATSPYEVERQQERRDKLRKDKDERTARGASS